MTPSIPGAKPQLWNPGAQQHFIPYHKKHTIKSFVPLVVKEKQSKHNFLTPPISPHPKELDPNFESQVHNYKSYPIIWHHQKFCTPSS